MFYTVSEISCLATKTGCAIVWCHCVGESMDVGSVIRTFRQRRGLSQGDLEKRTGLMRCYISRVENGHTVPSIETLSRIARALDAPLADLFLSADARVAPNDSTEQHFLEEMRRYLPELSPAEREQILEMVRRLASQSEA